MRVCPQSGPAHHICLLCVHPSLPGCDVCVSSAALTDSKLGFTPFSIQSEVHHGLGADCLPTSSPAQPPASHSLPGELLLPMHARTAGGFLCLECLLHLAILQLLLVLWAQGWFSKEKDLGLNPLVNS